MKRQYFNVQEDETIIVISDDEPSAKNSASSQQSNPQPSTSGIQSNLQPSTSGIQSNPQPSTSRGVQSNPQPSTSQEFNMLITSYKHSYLIPLCYHRPVAAQVEIPAYYVYPSDDEDEDPLCEELLPISSPESPAPELNAVMERMAGRPNDPSFCSVCLESTPSVLFMTCRHLATCWICLRGLQIQAKGATLKCPVCRQSGGYIMSILP